MERTKGGYEVKSGSTLQYSAEGALLDSYDATYCELELWALVQAQERELEAWKNRAFTASSDHKKAMKRADSAEAKLQAQEERIQSAEFEISHQVGNFTRELERAESAESRLAGLLSAANALEIALAEPAGGEYWTARKFLDEREIYHGDLQNERVLLRVIQAAIAEGEKP